VTPVSGTKSGNDMTIEIVDWDKHYENNRTRELKKMQWVPMPIRHDGAGYRQLIDHPNGAAHFGAWCALIEVAASCDVRGTLSRNSATPLSEADLARMTGIPEKIWKEAVPRLVSIGWIKNNENPAGTCDARPHLVAMNGMERKKEGREEKATYAEGVQMTKTEHSALVSQYGERVVKLAIEKVAAQQIKTGKLYKSPRGAILQWGIRAALEEAKKTPIDRSAPSSPLCHCGKPMERDHGYWACAEHGRQDDV